MQRGAAANPDVFSVEEMTGVGYALVAMIGDIEALADELYRLGGAS